jgi:hypothetical protein
VLAQSEAIQGGSVAFNVSWLVKSSETEREWVNIGCAYEAPGGVKCGAGDTYQNCTTELDCLTHDGRVWPSTGTCHGEHVTCIKGICQTGTPGGEACGHWADVEKWKNIGACVPVQSACDTCSNVIHSGGGGSALVVVVNVIQPACKTWHSFS